MISPVLRQNSAFLYLTHFVDRHVTSEFENLRKEVGALGRVVLLYHQLPHSELPGEEFEPYVVTDEMIKELGFRMMQDTIVPGHLVFLTVLFARAHPHYDYYWTIEQDVRFTGKWRSLFDDLNGNDADLLAPHIRKQSDEPDWYWWQSFSFPSANIDRKDRLRAFIPFYRLSRKAVQYIDNSLQLGCQGHTEVLVPTVLKYGRFKISDVRSTSRLGISTKYYTSITLKNGLLRFGGTFRYRPASRRAGWRKNKLYHPVKAGQQATARSQIWASYLKGILRYRLKSWLWRLNLLRARWR